MTCRTCSQPLLGTQRSFCSRKCNDQWRDTLHRELEIICAGCEQPVLISARAVRRGQKFCNRSCAQSSYNSNHYRGPDNPRWRGGRVLSYGPGWNEIKERVRDRDKNCRNCGKTPEANGRKLDVHHVGPFRFTGDNDLESLRALCRSCHMRDEDWGRRGSARFAGPRQLELKPLSQRELQRQRGRRIGWALAVSHQTVANWLSENLD